LGVSVSTLKRKFYSLGYENRWPYIRTVTPKRKSSSSNSRVGSSEEEDSFSEDVSDDEEDEAVVYDDEEEAKHTPKKRKQETVSDEEKVISIIPSNHFANSPPRTPSPTSFAHVVDATPQPPKTVGFLFDNKQADYSSSDEYISSEEEGESRLTIADSEPITSNKSNMMYPSSELVNEISRTSINDFCFEGNSNDYRSNHSHSHFLDNEQSQTSNQSTEEVLAASMLCSIASEKKRHHHHSTAMKPMMRTGFNSPSIFKASSNFSSYSQATTPLPPKKRLPSFYEYQKSQTANPLVYNVHSTSTNELILPPIQNNHLSM